MPYWEAVNHLLQMYGTDDVIIEADNNLMGFTQLPNESPTENAKVLWNKALRCYRVYD